MSGHRIHEDLYASHAGYWGTIEDPGDGNQINLANKSHTHVLLEGGGTRTLPPAAQEPAGIRVVIQNKGNAGAVNITGLPSVQGAGTSQVALPAGALVELINTVVQVGQNATHVWQRIAGNEDTVS